jgi:hypothetical protein
MFDKDHRMCGHLTVIRLPGVGLADKPTYDAKAATTGKTVQSDQGHYWLELIIIGQ